MLPVRLTPGGDVWKGSDHVGLPSEGNGPKSKHAEDNRKEKRNIQ